MPAQRLKLIKTEDQEHRARLSRLEQLRIPIGQVGDPSHEPDRLILEQAEHECASIYELPLGEVAVVVPAKMHVLNSGILITDVAMMMPWDDWPLDLWKPEGKSNYYDELIGRLYHFPPRLLNPYLKSELPLDVRQVDGVIIARGYSSIPSKFHDESPVTVELLLMDKRRNELCFEFGVRVDRSVMRECKRKQLERCEFARTRGRGLYEPKVGGRPADQKSVSLKKVIDQSHTSGGHDATYGPRILETGPSDR
jgi:hypothetical protein